MLRFAVLGLVATEALFLRVPWKPTHLLPCLMTLLLWAASDRNRRPFLWVVVGAMAINGLVVFRPFIADVPNSTTGRRLRAGRHRGLAAQRDRLPDRVCTSRCGSRRARPARSSHAGTSDGATGTLE